MNPQELPQSNSDQPEIYRLLKIGNFDVTADATGFVLKQSAQIEAKPLELPKNEKGLEVTNFLAFLRRIFHPYKSILVYPAVFAGSFLIFYSTMNFPSLAAQAQGFFAKPQDQQILGEDLTAYNQWIGGYFYSVSNKDLLAPDNDYDNDGLTNYDEYMLRTNPTLSDSDGDGTADGVEALNSTNPWGAGGLTSDQSKLLTNVNLNMVSERISYAVSSNKGSAITTADADNFDLSKPGVLSIPKLNISAPFIFSPDASAFDNDLEHGVIHYPGTALPGEVGTMYVSGHSSDYVWKHDPFATIFTKINYLKPGDDIYITVYGKDGKVYNYRYRVTGQNVFSPDDQTQFIDNSSAKLNLSTCWPIGTAKNRMVVSAELSSL
ncbi:MAG TPA: sortase [Patescibacteria group bacterium]|nr:sortase [Patescibacteria group bacterium]